jgi:hypothetical protein
MKEFAFKVFAELLLDVVPGAVLSPEPIPKGELVVDVVDVVDIMFSSKDWFTFIRIRHPVSEQ